MTTNLSITTPTTLSTGVPPFVLRDPNVRRRELLADLNALATTPGGHADAVTAQTRPAILRRLAALVADQVPAGTDRIVANSADTALAAAVALHTGIPHATIASLTAVTGKDTDPAERGGPDVIGELYPSEVVAAIGYAPDSSDTLLEPLQQLGVYVCRVITVLGPDGPGTQGPDENEARSSTDTNPPRVAVLPAEPTLKENDQ